VTLEILRMNSCGPIKIVDSLNIEKKIQLIHNNELTN